MLYKEVVEPISKRWASKLDSGPKKDTFLQFLVEFKKSSSTTTREAYQLPRMDEHIDLMSSADICLILDESAGYWRIVRKPFETKTSFDMPSRTVPIHTNIIQSPHHTSHLPESNGSDTSIRQGEVGTRSPDEIFIFLKIVKQGVAYVQEIISLL